MCCSSKQTKYRGKSKEVYPCQSHFWYFTVLTIIMVSIELTLINAVILVLCRMRRNIYAITITCIFFNHPIC